MKNTKTTFATFCETLSAPENELLTRFFSEFDTHFLVSKSNRRQFKADFEAAIMMLYKEDVPMEEILSRLALSNLGGFYARPSVMWFPLDDAAKIYPISMEHGSQQVFRVSVYFKEAVIPELLQMALTFTIKRFASFATTLKKGFFWHYLDTVKRRFSIEEEHSIPCQPIKVSSSGSQSFRLMYYQNRVSAEFFHVLTDGTGAITFFRSLISEYLRLRGVKAPLGDIWNVNDTPAKEEFENAFVKVEKAKNSSGFVEQLRLCRQACRADEWQADTQKALPHFALFDGCRPLARGCKTAQCNHYGIFADANVLCLLRIDR